MTSSKQHIKINLYFQLFIVNSYIQNDNISRNGIDSINPNSSIGWVEFTCNVHGTTVQTRNPDHSALPAFALEVHSAVND